jgi:uncharacterized membrane protein YphA (DoxX/SURF4 family)
VTFLSIQASLLVAARLSLALVLIPGAVAKLLDRRRFTAGIVDYRIVPEPVASALGIVIPVAELGIGLGLLAGMVPAVVGPAATALFVVFTIAVAVNLRRGRAIQCNCFGVAATSTIGAGTIARNCFLLALCACTVVLGTLIVPLDRWAGPWPIGDLAGPLTSADWVIPTLMLVGWCTAVVHLLEWTVDIGWKAARLGSKETAHP